MNGVAARKRGNVPRQTLDGHVLVMEKRPLGMTAAQVHDPWKVPSQRRSPGIAELTIAAQESGAAWERTLLRLGLGSYM